MKIAEETRGKLKKHYGFIGSVLRKLLVIDSKNFMKLIYLAVISAKAII